MAKPVATIDSIAMAVMYQLCKTSRAKPDARPKFDVKYVLVHTRDRLFLCTSNQNNGGAPLTANSTQMFKVAKMRLLICGA